MECGTTFPLHIKKPMFIFFCVITTIQLFFLTINNLNTQYTCYKKLRHLSLTNLTAGLLGTAPGIRTGPTHSRNLSGDRPRISFAASSNSFCSFACFFLKIEKKI